MYDEHVSAGQPLKISARTWNNVVDAAKAVRNGLFGPVGPGQRFTPQNTLIHVRNDTGGDLDRFAVVQVQEPLVDPTDNMIAFKDSTAMIGITPDTDRSGRFAILQEPIKAGMIGVACIAGISVAYVEIVDEEHAYADVASGVTANLASGSNGAAQLLWVQAVEDREVEDYAWALVRVGSPATSAVRMAIVVDCDYDDVSGSLIVHCAPLLGVDYSYDPEAVDLITAWAGPDPVVVYDCMVEIKPIEPLEMNPEIQFFAQACLSAERTMLDMPDMTCLTAYSEPCGPMQSTDLCLG